MPATGTKTGKKRDENINLRASRSQKNLIDRAADSLGRNRSDFNSSLKGYEELADHCYGRTVLGKEIDDDGRAKSQFTYRITQANVGYVEGSCYVLARNSPIASKLVTANPGDES